MAGPLQGVKVFDLTVVGVGPFATMILASMGANVVKVEPPAWPPARQGSPPFYKGLSIVYMGCQLGKRSVFLDLKKPEGMEAARQLLEEADVFAENMRYGAVQRLGLRYEEVSKLNPRIVYGNFPGWASTGPYAERHSGAHIAHAFSGATAITGRKGGEPESLSWPLHDFNASSTSPWFSSWASLARIHRRRASGQCPEVARGCSCESGIMVLKQQSRPQNKEHPIDATTQPSRSHPNRV